MAYESKILISHKDKDLLKRKLESFIQPSKQMTKKGTDVLTVRSIYFDTPAFDFYNFKIDNMIVRKNIRLSAHNQDTQKVFLELSRLNENLYFKSKATADFERVKQLFKGDIYSNEFLWNIKKSETASRFFYQIHRYNLRPTIKIVHDREVFVSKIMDKENDFKVIFQQNIRCAPFPTLESLFEENTMNPVMQDRILFVFRYERACPAWFKPLLTGLSPLSGRVSKYRVSMESLPQIRTRSRLDNLLRGSLIQKAHFSI